MNSRSRYARYDEYGLRHMPRHLAQRRDEKKLTILHDMLLDFDWLETKLNAIDVDALIVDYDLLSNDMEVRLVQDALRLSASVLIQYKNQLVESLLGRMLDFHQKEIRDLIKKARSRKSGIWLCPTTRSLQSPREPLLHTILGDFKGLYANLPRVGRLELLPNGRQVFSWDGSTLKVWELETGTVLHMIEVSPDILGSSQVLAVTPDGKTGISSTSSPLIKVWNLKTGLQLFTLKGHTAEINALAITPNGEKLISASEDNTLRVWNLSSGAVLHVLKVHGGPIIDLAVILHGKRVVSVSGYRTLEFNVWDLDSGVELRSFGRQVDTSSTLLAIPTNGKQIVSSDGQSLKVWDLKTGIELHILKGHTAEITALALTPDEKRVISASKDQTLRVWHLETGRELCTLAVKTEVTRIKVFPDGNRIVTACENDICWVWDMDTGNELHILKGHTAAITDLAICPDGKRIVSASSDKTFKVWRVGKDVYKDSLEVHSDHVTSIVANLNGKRVIAGTLDGSIKVWDLETGIELHTLKGHSAQVSALALTPDEKQVISASQDQTLKIWNLETGEEWCTFAGNTEGIIKLIMSSDGKRFISSTANKTLKVWDLKAGVELWDLNRLWNLNTTVKYSYTHGYNLADTMILTPDGKRVIGWDDLILKVWDFETGRELYALAEYNLDVLKFILTPDGMMAIAAQKDASEINIWNLNSRTEVFTLPLDASPNILFVSSDGKYLIGVVDEEHQLWVWDLETGDSLYYVDLSGSSWLNKAVMTLDGKQVVLVSAEGNLLIGDLEKWQREDDWENSIWETRGGSHILAEHTGHIVELVLTQDGKMIISASLDRSLRVWDLESLKCIATFFTGDAISWLTISPNCRTLFARDEGGRMNILHLEGV